MKSTTLVTIMIHPFSMGLRLIPGTWVLFVNINKRESYKVLLRLEGEIIVTLI